MLPDSCPERDPCAVDTVPLAGAIQNFLNEWAQHRPKTSGQFSRGGGRGEVSPVGGVAWLEEETRSLDIVYGQGVPASSIENIRHARYTTTELRVADLLVTAIDRPDLLHTFTIRPNPMASRKRQSECCGGTGG